MKNKDLLLSAVLLLVAILLHSSNAIENTTRNNTDNHDEENATTPLIIAWFEKPPYTTAPTNGSLNDGLIRDAVASYIVARCPGIHNVNGFEILRVNSESAMIDLFKQGKAHIVSPIFENPNKRLYSEFPFFKVADYPGTDFFSIDGKTQAAGVIMDAVAKSWPLLTVTIVLTAIAGVIMWALDTYWNQEEFPRSFVRGSWDGFWWSFISMTTVGYGDKVPKSIIARVFSIIWILMGLIIMAIFTASITSALTALSLELAPNDLNGTKVAVVGNGTEYQHALEEGASPKVYNRIDDAIEAMKAVEVDGMLLDRYTASYYQKREKLKSLVTVKKLELAREVGMLFAKDYSSLAECLNLYRASIWKSVQTITDTFKLTQQKPTKSFSVFDESSSHVKTMLYASLGVLASLFLIGGLWEIICKRKAKNKHNIEQGAAINEGMSMCERKTIYEDLEQVKRLFRQTQDRFEKLQEKLSSFQDR